MKQRPRPEPKPTPPHPAASPSPSLPEGLPLTTKGHELEGPAAEEAARRLAMDVLSSRAGTASELVLSRPDAWRLLGIDIGTLQEDRIPGLVLTEDLEQTRAVLKRQTVARRVLITYDSDAEDVRISLSRQQSQIAVISLLTQTETTMGVTHDSEVSVNAVGLPGPARLATLSKDDAFVQLMSMPTVAQRPTRL
ncbi:hypothetical protein AB0H37_34775 [Actinomadura sp. NPDC023710]|uniref:hypothetical protein n=1 Tax=Actinomadura sp. NPDC023710 TaxID=3158219 RepID=UPI0033FAE7D9